ncbi:MAG: substrate-binding domain-containing protein, partial [Anaerolineales bacterium]|nr:substrate-binding domain-containing protein [Anaerolineales bacterium]
LLDERQIKPQAIAAADDAIAMGVLREAQARGWSIPSEFALTGFDDLSESRFLSPTLTTVRQPFYEQSYTAAMMLLDRIEGKSIPQRVVLPTQLVVRQSCGCLPSSVHLAGKAGMPGKYAAADDPWREYVIEVVQEAAGQSFIGQVNEELLPDWVTQIVDGLLADLDKSEGSQFIQALDKILHQASVQRSEISLWQDIISTLRRAVLARLLEVDKRLRAENLFSQARVLISEAAERVQAYQLQQLQYHYAVESEVDQSVLTTLDIEELKTIISKTLAALGIPGGYIVLSAEEKYAAANLFLAFDERGILHEGHATPFDPRQSLVPPECLPQDRRYTHVIEALYFQRDQLGFGLFEMGSRNGAIYATLRRQLSSALRGALLLQEYKLAQTRIQAVNKELEVFSYSVSHDLKAPLRAISQLASWIVEDSGPQLDRDGQEKLLMLIDRVQHMHRLIDGILEYSRIGRVSEKATSIDLNEVVAELIRLLDPPDTVRIAVEGVLPTITGEPAHLHQVFQNLLNNAISYMDKPEGLIQIKAEEMDDGWLVSVADNGPGIEEKYHEKIFQMFQTLGTRKDLDSTGIGLALVKRIVEKWGGKIRVESQVGQGSTFFFTIPKTRSEV